MVDWTPEAIEAAHCAMFQEPYDGTTAPMIGAGLDAAAAQGIKDEENARLREELAAAQSRITDLTKISATLNVRTSKLNALREENARLREALAPFVDAGHLKVYISSASTKEECWVSINIKNRDLRAAAAAILEGVKNEN